MCKWNTRAQIYVIRRANPFVSDGWHMIYVDSCIAEELQQLNEIGIITLNSCCGHGKDKATCFIAEESVELAKEWRYEAYEYSPEHPPMIDLATKEKP